MNYSTYRFTLNLHSSQSQVSLPVSQYDNARVLLINLSDGGLPYVIEDGCLAMLEIKRPRGSILQSFCIIEKNATVRYEFSQDEGAASVEDGVHDCSVNLYDSEGHILGTPRFTMIVSERVVNSDDIDFSANDKTAIDAMIEKEAERQTNEGGRISAEAERQTNEGGRISAEAERQTNEGGRISAEAERQTNESERQKVIENLLEELNKQKTAISSLSNKDTELSEKISRKVERQPYTGGAYYVYAETESGTVKQVYEKRTWANSIAQRHNNGALRVGTPTEGEDAVNLAYLDSVVGNIETALDGIIEIQNSLIGGDA